MDEEKKHVRRRRRTREQRIKDIDAKIAKLQAEKAELEKPIKIQQILEKAYDEYLELKKSNLWGSKKYY